MSDYSLEQAKIDIARLQNEIGQYKRVLKVFPNLVDIRGDVKLSGTSTGFTPTQLDANGTILGIGAIADGESLARIGTEVIGLNGGWIPAGETWTYASSTTVTISGDKTNKYSKGMKVKLTQTSVKYFYITAVSYSSPNTTLTLTAGTDSTVANDAITSPFYSMMDNPAGFQHWFSYTPIVSGTGGSLGTYEGISDRSKFSVVGNNCYWNYHVYILDKGSWSNTLQVSLPIKASDFFQQIYGFVANQWEQWGTGTVFYGGVYTLSSVVYFNKGIGGNDVQWSDLTPRFDIWISGAYQI